MGEEDWLKLGFKKEISWKKLKMWKTITLNLMFQRNQKRLGEG